MKLSCFIRSQDFVNLDAMDITDVLELIEVCQDTLDEVWKQVNYDPYPEKRMRQLLQVIGNNFAQPSNCNFFNS